MSEHLNEQQISSEVWLAVLLPLLEDGYTLKLSPSGNSMYPFMVGGRDFVVLRHIGNRPVPRGAIVLYRRDNGMVILHRIYRRTANSYLLLGDNQTEIEYGIRPDQICAVEIGRAHV